MTGSGYGMRRAGGLADSSRSLVMAVGHVSSLTDA